MACLLAVFAAGWWFFSRVAKVVTALQPVPPAVRFKTVPPSATKAHVFTRDETLQFLVAAQDAEDIKDPLQRCLKFPDPPGSHWNHAAVVAYCHYRNQPLITFAQAKQLIESGHAAKLDQLLAQALHEQQTDPAAVGRLDRIYQQDFDTGSFDVRPVLDAWKKQSPKSAFAYAASGVAYAEMAYTARGGKWNTETPDSNFEAMNRLAVEANTDLQHALQLDPKLTPAYRSMIMLGGIAIGSDYARSAVKRGLAVAPADLGIYDQWMWLEEPKWYGSFAAMAHVADVARTHLRSNPTLDLESRATGWYRVSNCECSSAQQLAGYRAVADQLVGVGTLESAGDAAWDVGDRNAQAVFYSEALRFNPDLDSVRVNRMYTLMYFHHLDWAKAEGDRILAHSADDEAAYKARGLAYAELFNAYAAAQDFEDAVKLDPKDDEAEWFLGKARALQLRWNDAWAISNKLVNEYPKYAEGWLLRARVQIGEPRPGAEETLAYLDQHFASNSQVALEIAGLRSYAKWLAAHPEARHPKKHVIKVHTD